MADELMTVDEIADALRVPVNTVYYWRSRREGPPMFLLGRALRCRRSNFESWLTQLEGSAR